MRKYFRANLSILASAIILFCSACSDTQSAEEKAGDSTIAKKDQPRNTLDTATYDRLIQEMSNNDTTGKWPVKMPYPLPGAILPFKRVIAYYGNLYSKRMGALGEFPKAEMLKRLQDEVANWQAADTATPTIPALHYVAVTAQVAPGKDGKYRLRMPFSQVDTIINWAREINGLAFVDIQVGHSSVKAEVAEFEKYMKMPDVHMGIDPEFSMKGGEKPGSRIGTFTAEDINDAIDFLAKVVRENNIPPKMLVVHRFTQGMITGYERIKKTPEVQVVIDMDGFGDKILKRSTWLRYVYKEPIMFTGFKIFYGNDTKTGKDQLYTPEELLKFTPKPMYIQYQ